MRIEKYTYDETNKRTRAIEEVMQGKERQFLDIIRLYEFVSQNEFVHMTLRYGKKSRVGGVYSIWQATKYPIPS